ncbi:MAG TPA: hypothetical protein VHK27_05510 [Gammaproteobacteria bacterium]|nr:hypothetical protein [Gammaproteobacteria bacterium]
MVNDRLFCFGYVKMLYANVASYPTGFAVAPRRFNKQAARRRNLAAVNPGCNLDQPRFKASRIPYGFFIPCLHRCHVSELTAR